MLSGEAANANFIVLVLPHRGLNQRSITLKTDLLIITLLMQSFSFDCCNN